MRTHAARLIGQRTRRLPGTLARPAALWAGIGTTTAAGGKPMLLAAKTSRAVWVRSPTTRTGVVALVIAVGVGVLVATRPSSGVPPPVQPSAADRGAPPSLVKAASAIGFRPSTEPGVGVIEGKPASAAQPPANAGLLPVGSRAPSFALETPEGKTVGLSSLRGRAVLLDADSSVHGGAAVRDPDRGRQGT
jgi:hypothetical protein